MGYLFQESANDVDFLRPVTGTVGFPPSATVTFAGHVNAGSIPV
jgi:hypothetical protein